MIFEIITISMPLPYLVGSILLPNVLVYIGPGAAVTSIGALIAIIAAVIIAIVGFIWYPIKRILRKRKKTNRQAESKTK